MYFDTSLEGPREKLARLGIGGDWRLAPEWALKETQYYRLRRMEVSPKDASAIWNGIVRGSRFFLAGI